MHPTILGLFFFEPSCLFGCAAAWKTTMMAEGVGHFGAIGPGFLHQVPTLFVTGPQVTLNLETFKNFSDPLEELL